MRKAQAALEFLTTYGWAFLVILIMIGALAYFGVLNPKGLLPGRCTFGPEVDCVEYTIDSTTVTVKFRFRNNAGATADFNFTATYLAGTNPFVDCTDPLTGLPVDNLQPGRIAEIECDFSGLPTPPDFPVGDKVKFEINGYYQKTGGVYWTPVNGEIFGDAQ